MSSVNRMTAVRLLLSFLLAFATPAAAREPAQCRTVKLSDIGWTDVTASTATLSVVLSALGYTPKVTVLSVPVTYAAMRNRDIDVFLGNWMPSMEADRHAFVADKSVDVLGPILTGAKYTLAVPDYLYDAGLRDFADIARFAGPLGNQIYGIEPGNDGDRLVLKMIADNRFGLGGFKLVESSEQGMLAEVERATKARDPVVFLGWNPHPMNLRFKMRYLSGGDAVFGPNFGGASVFKNTRAGYVAACPNVGRLVSNMELSIDETNALMSAILDRKQASAAAAKTWLAAHPERSAQWLQGVTTADGKPAAAALAAAVTGATASTPFYLTKLPVGDWMTELVDAVKTQSWFFNGVSAVVTNLVGALTVALNAVPPLVLIGLSCALVWWLKRSVRLAVFVGAALLFIVNQGYWAATVETLALVGFATLISSLIGIPIGIAAGHRPGLGNALRPVLDLMQTLPTFVYLIPTLVLFGLGIVPGLISTIIFALPAPVRLTQLGIESVPPALVEAGEAFGATRRQLLWKVELPSAAPMIQAGITQCIMLSLSMVVIAALVGAGGLGVPVVRALNTVQVGMGFEAGFAIVLLAIILDRVSRPAKAAR